MLTFGARTTPSRMSEIPAEPVSWSACGQLANEFRPPPQLFGARPLKRVIRQMVENPLAEKLLSGAFPDGTAVTIGLDNDTVTFA